jgi:hypothetical protein
MRVEIASLLMKKTTIFFFENHRRKEKKRFREKTAFLLSHHCIKVDQNDELLEVL